MKSPAPSIFLKHLPVRLLLMFLLFFQQALPIHASPAHTGSNFTAGNGMAMMWVEPIKGWVGKYVVTQEEYQKVMGTNPSQYKGLRLPVETVNWFEALDYCKKLTEQDHVSGILPAGCQYSLPTDAQYDIFVGDAGGMDDTAQLLNQQKPNFTADVGTKGANQYGLYDTRGLFWQWCLDDFKRKSMNIGLDIVKRYYYLGPGIGKVLRGGTLPHCDVVVPVVYRYRGSPGLHFCLYGFRAVIVSAQKGA